VFRVVVEGVYTVSGAAFSLPLNDSHYFLHRLLVSASSWEPPKTLRKPCADTNTSHSVAGCRTPFTALRQVLCQAERCGYLKQREYQIQTYLCCYLLYRASVERVHV
jgi:hypothetical protein